MNQRAISSRALSVDFQTRWRSLLASYGVFVALLLLVIAATALSPQNFLKPSNFANILKQSTGLSLLAVGETFVLLIGGIDLSVGSVASFASVTLGVIVAENPNFLIPSIFAAIGFALLTGFVNGFLIARFRVPAFIVTLGTLFSVQGLNLVWTHGGPRGQFGAQFRWISEGFIGPVPVAGIFLLVVVIAATLLDTRTVFGRLIHAVGGNEQATRLSGSSVTRIKIATYMVCSFFACLGGIYMTARVGGGQAWLAQGMELDAIAASVMGGTSMFGGRGGIPGTIGGVLILVTVYNILNLLAISFQFQHLAKGIFIIVAVALYARARRY